MLKKAAAYARVSTLHQSDLSLVGQFEECDRYAEGNEIEIVAYYADKETGKVNRREQLDELIDHANRGEFEYILVDDFDRFSRAGARGEVFIQDLEEKTGVRVIAVRDLVDTSTYMGKVYRGMKLILSGAERDRIVEKTKVRMKNYASMGYWMGGNPPYGLKAVEVKDKEGKPRKVLEVDEQEAPVVHEIFALFAQGKSINFICEFFADRKILNRKGKPWSKTAIWDILHNEKYIGSIVYGKGSKRYHHINRKDALIVENAIDAIISRELWEKVQERFSKHSWSPRVHFYLLTGLIKCGDCGASLVGNGSKKTSYVCSAWKNHKPVRYVGVAKSKVEKFVIDYIRHEMFGDMDNADYEEIAQEMNRRAVREDKIRGKRIEYLKKQLFEVQAQEANLVEAIKSGVEILLLKEEASRIKEKRESIQNELNYLENPEKQHFVTAHELKEKWENIKNNLDSGDCYKLDEAIHNLIERVDVFPDGYIRIVESDA